MKKLMLLCCLLACTLTACATTDVDRKIDTGVADILKNISEPVIPDRQLDLIKVSGLKPDSKGTKDFQKAIAGAVEKLAEAGGGSLIFSNPGSGEAVYRIKGPIELKSNVALRLARGVRLQFEFDPPSYLPGGKGILSRYEGTLVYTYSPLIRAFNCENIAITALPGSGPLPVIDGDGKAWRKWEEAGNRSRGGQTDKKASYLMIKQVNNDGTPIPERRFGDEYLRPSIMQFFCSKQVLVENVKLVNSPFWTVHPLFSQNLIFRGIEFEALNANNDGIDPESSRYVLIENVKFNNGDDNVAIKAGRDLEGREGVSIKGTELEGLDLPWINDGIIRGPTSHVLIRNCEFRGHYAVCIGSEMSGGAHDIYALDNFAEESVRMGFYIKGGRNRGGEVHDVFVRNMHLNEVKKEVVRLIPNYDNDLTSPWPSKFRDIYIENMTAKKAALGIRIVGWPDATIDNVTLKDLKVDKVEGKPLFEYNHVTNLKLENVVVEGRDLSGTYTLSDPDGVSPKR